HILLFYYLVFSYYKGVTMSNKFLEKVVKFLNVMGIAASSIYGLLIVLELLTEWYENGTLLRVWNFVTKTILFAAWLFIIWILHRLAMFALHKLWPDTYDEYGHMKK
ncbi:MAG: hypothetical protein IJ597_06660, partial [Synergistaceae bacterium]|nr:hypothetical protein [Synergistaceae bacterium]